MCVPPTETRHNQEADCQHILPSLGATWGATFDETPKLSFDKLLSVNLVGLFECSQAFVSLLEAGATQAHAAVCNAATFITRRAARAHMRIPMESGVGCR